VCTKVKPPLFTPKAPPAKKSPKSLNTLDNSGDDGSGEEGEAGGEGSGSQGSSRKAMLVMQSPTLETTVSFVGSSDKAVEVREAGGEGSGSQSSSRTMLVTQSPPLEATVSFVGSSDKGVATNRLLAKARLQGASSSLGLKGVLAEVKSSSGGHMPLTRLFTAAVTRRERLDQWRATKATASSIRVNTSTRGPRPNHLTTTTNNNNNSFQRPRAEHKRTHPHGYAANGSSIVDFSSRLTKENSHPSLTPY